MDSLKPRAYQLEMLEQSLDRNIIVAVPTGGGKTLIAALRIQFELERTTQDKRVWFLCPTVELARQQRTLLQQSLPPAYEVLVLCGSDGVDRWKSPKVWERILFKKSVVVCTYQVLCGALEGGFVHLSEISLLVFDEAHHCQKKHPSNRIMQKFYHPAKRAKEEIPYVLGLTASPVNSKPKNLEAIEANLDSISRTPKATQEELIQYLNLPEIVIRTYHVAWDDSPAALRELTQLHCRLHARIEADPYVVHLRSRVLTQHNIALEKKLEEAIVSGKTWCQEQIQRLLTVSKEMQAELGHWSFWTYLKTCLAKLALWNGDQQQDDSDGLRRDEVSYLKESLSTIQMSETCPDISDPANHSSKVNLLIETIVEEMQGRVAGIIHVKTRAAVKLLSMLLATHPRTSSILRVGTMVGSSVPRSGPSHISELVDSTNQENTLDELRKEIRNLVVATDVVEEGIDVPACNLMICADRPANLKSFIQWRGRARKEDSKFIILFKHDENMLVEQWKDFEVELKKKYDDELRILQKLEKLESEETGYREFIVKSTGAKLTLDNSVVRLNHFCAKLPRVLFTHSEPVFMCKRDNETDSVRCDLLLPNNVDECLRRHSSRDVRRTEALAKKDAAFEAVLSLYNAGLINDHLVPLDVFDQEAVEAIAAIRTRAHVAAVAEQINIWSYLAQQWNTSVRLHTCVLSMTMSSNQTRRIKFATSVPFPKLDDLKLHLDRTTTTTLSFFLEEIDPQELDASRANEVTRLILRAGIRSRVDVGRTGFPLVCVPCDILGDMASWLAMMTGDYPGSDLVENDFPEPETIGIARDLGNHEAAYTILGREEVLCQPDIKKPSITKLMLKAQKLPKRKDFLHEVPPHSTESEASVTFLDPTGCRVDRIPAEWAHFALFIPSIFHHISIHYTAEHLRLSIFETVFPQNDHVSLILEAISTSRARGNSNYQRLEFLGDALLKVYSSLALFVARPFWHEGYLTMAKCQIVSNENLAAVAERIGLSKYILVQPFTGAKWRPSYNEDLLDAKASAIRANTSRELSTKVLADVVEAILGAAWQAGGEQSLLNCMRIFFPKMEWMPSSQALSMIKNRTRECTVPKPYSTELTKLVGHEFESLPLLLEATTHPSYNVNIESTPSYQRLEFLGDALLEAVITIRLWRAPGNIPEKYMHRVRTAIVNGPFLAFCAMGYNIEVQNTQPITTNDSSAQQDENCKIVEEDGIPLKEGTSKKHLLSFLRGHQSANFSNSRAQAIEQHKYWAPSITARLEKGEGYPWVELSAFSPPKFVSDMVESVAAAIAIDHGSLGLELEGIGAPSPLSLFLRRLGVLPWMEAILALDPAKSPSYDPYRAWHPLEEIGYLGTQRGLRYENWSNDQTKSTPIVTSATEKDAAGPRTPPQTAKSATSNEETKIHYCRVIVGEQEIATAEGSTSADAKIRAVEAAVLRLREETLRGEQMEGVEMQGTDH